MSVWHHQITRKRGLDATHRPNVQIMKLRHAGEAFERPSNFCGIYSWLDSLNRHNDRAIEQAPSAPDNKSGDNEADDGIEREPWADQSARRATHILATPTSSSG